jgi:nickel superoxide dismutase
MMRLLTFIFKFIPIQTAYAHCDIPCGIYDPTPMQIAVHTIFRMTQFLKEVKRGDETAAEHTIARITHVKEEHGQRLEEELGTLENDYFKKEHYEGYPNLQTLLSDSVKLSVTTRQHIDLEAASQLLEKVMQIAEIFYKTKGFEPVRVASGYPTEKEIVTHK